MARTVNRADEAPAAAQSDGSRSHDSQLHTRNPEREFGDPRRLADESALSTREKLEILVSWRADLIELLRAEEENMPIAGADVDATGRKLSEVSAVMAVLQQRLAAASGATEDRS